MSTSHGWTRGVNYKSEWERTSDAFENSLEPTDGCGIFKNLVPQWQDGRWSAEGRRKLREKGSKSGGEGSLIEEPSRGQVL